MPSGKANWLSLRHTIAGQLLDLIGEALVNEVLYQDYGDVGAAVSLTQ